MNSEKANPTRDTWAKLQILSEIFGKLFIPVVVIVLPWLWTMYQSNLQKRQQEAIIEQKALDIFYKDMSSGNPMQQNLAVGLLKMVKPDFAVRLSGVINELHPERRLDLVKSIITDEAQSDMVRTEAKRIINNLANDTTQSPEIRNEADRVKNTPLKPIGAQPTNRR
ncbi:MAG: hypothetical protein ACETVX_02420 [bacterium]